MPRGPRFGAFPIATSAFQVSCTSVSQVRIPTTVSEPTPETSATPAKIVVNHFATQ